MSYVQRFLRRRVEDIQRFRQIEESDAMKVLEIHRAFLKETRGVKVLGMLGLGLKGGFNV